MSKYKNQPSVCVFMNFSFASFSQFFFRSYSTILYLLPGTFCNNTIITAFWICIARGLSTDQACDISVMNEGNIASTEQKNSCYS